MNDEEIKISVEKDFEGFPTEAIAQNLMDHDLISIDQSGMTRQELIAVIVNHRKSLL